MKNGVRATTAAILLAMSAGMALAQGTPCDKALVALKGALAGSDLAAVRRAGDAALAPGACTAAQQVVIGRTAALAHLATDEKSQHLPAAERLAVLELGAKYAKPWQLMQAIGALREKTPAGNGRINYARASEAYQAALADIAELDNEGAKSRKKGKSGASDADIKRLVRLSQQTRSLADGFVAASILGTRDIRGVEVEHDAPVEFVRGTDTMTEKGRQYADDLLAMLRANGEPGVTLVGHTDPDGGHEYNDALSLRRAQAVARFLANAHYRGKVAVEGKGKRDLRKLENPDSYSKDQIYQMHRRVEARLAR